jgi:hypothetical protein
MTDPDDALTTRLHRLESDLARCVDVEEIKTLKARYFRYLDLHWWDEFRGLFTDDAQFEIAESTSRPGSIDDFIASVSRHLGRAMSVHHGHMPEITLVDRDHAHGIWAMFDLVEPAADSGYPVLTGFGHYTEEYRKVDGHWRIARLRLTRLKRSVGAEVREGATVDGARAFVEPR